MEQAVGIHDFAELKLGLKPATPAVAALELGDFLTGAIPVYPDAVDHLKSVSYGLYQNDRYGVCGPVAVANHRRMTTALLEGKMVAPSLEAVFDLYRRSGNPNFNPATGADDNGVVMQPMLQQVQNVGIDGVKCLAFARVRLSNLNELDAAIAIFGAVLFGVNLQSAQQAQTNAGRWDYVPSGQWGGHAVMGGAYIPEGGNDVITWGKRVTMTDRFIRNQVMEGWVVVWPEHLKQRQFLESLDVYKLAEGFEALTGKKFPVVLPPKPNPGPIVPPAGTWEIILRGKGPKPEVIQKVAEALTDDFDFLPPLES